MKTSAILLLKSKGVIHNINDYRGIFLRNIIFSVYQKWLYCRNAPIVDGNGTEYACGGRKERSGTEALLIVKLVQDYARWMKTPMIIKFLDVEKFFDSMNFKKSLIEAYCCGVKGRFWQCYKVINERKQCIPFVPSGECSPIEMHEVFVQGSCDAVLMAWPLMDAESKKVNDPFTTDCCIDGIPINKLSFVDDMIEFNKSEEGTNERSISNEIFEKKTRLNLKTSKCKILPMNVKKISELFLDNEEMENVAEHVYLGSIISSDGQRVKDMQDRIKNSKSVANEVAQICKETELSRIRLRYVKMLLSSCLDSKVKYGCALWNVSSNKKALSDLNQLKPKALKRVMELPNATPSDAVLYEFGINDLSLDVLMEKVVLAVETLNREDETERVAKQLLKSLMEKNVPGFCTELSEACNIIGVSISDFDDVKDVRKVLKEKIIELQSKELYKRMLLSSKMDRILLNGYKFDGKPMKYLFELEFVEARAVFMVRYRMLPTKSNFPGRWPGTTCNICGFEDTDPHIFCCPGFQDLIPANVTYDAYWDTEVLNNAERIRSAAGAAIGIIERLEDIQGMEAKRGQRNPDL